MHIHVQGFRILKEVRHLEAGTLLFLSTVLLKLAAASLQKPQLLLPPASAAPVGDSEDPDADGSESDGSESESESEPPLSITSLVAATPSLHLPFIPHPLTALGPPLLRGIITTSFLGSYMSSLSTFGSFDLTSIIGGLRGNHIADTVEKIDLPDGGVCSISWSMGPPPTHKGAAVVLLLPGLNNSSETGFVRRLARLLTSSSSSSSSSSVCTLDYRHVGHTRNFPSSSVRPCCADSYRDFPTVLKYVREKYGPRSLVLVGQSLGAGMGLRSLGEMPAETVW